MTRNLHLPLSLPASGQSEFARFSSRRSTVYSAKGMVSASQPYACEAGLAILRQGGNAADAAVAVSAALNVTEPGSCGIGGDAFCLWYDAKTKQVKGLNGSGRAPQALTLEGLRKKGIKGAEIPLGNLNAVTVPGCAAAWIDTIELYGSGKITIKEALEPAIKMAEEGQVFAHSGRVLVPISSISAHQWHHAYRHLVRASPNSAEMLIMDPETKKTHAPRAGEIYKNPTLAQTFRELINAGKDGFYKGRIAQAIVDIIKDGGGEMTLEDLSSHTSTQVDPISMSYGGHKGVRLWEIPPNGQGIVALIALGIVDILQDTGKVDMSKADHNSPEWLHVIIEVLRLAFADARAYVADPEKMRVPIKELLSKDYLTQRAALFDPEKANPIIKKGAPFASSDTVQFSVADAEGNAMSYIQSNYAGFGTSAVPKGCGFTLQNRGSSFTLVEGHPNCAEGGKRPYHTIIPALVTRGNKEDQDLDLFMAFGVMGGFNQPQGQLQVLLNMLHHGHDPQEAIDAPRICIGAGLPDSSVNPEDAGDINSEVFLEYGIPEATFDKLKEMGHDVRLLKGHDRAMFGRGQIIQKLSNGVWAGGSDPRADGHAVPQFFQETLPLFIGHGVPMFLLDGEGALPDLGHVLTDRLRRLRFPFGLDQDLSVAVFASSDADRRDVKTLRDEGCETGGYGLDDYGKGARGLNGQSVLVDLQRRGDGLALHSIARQRGLSLRGQTNVTHDGYSSRGEALDQIRDLLAAFQLDGIHLPFLDQTDCTLTALLGRGVEGAKGEIGDDISSSERSVVDGYPHATMARESPTRHTSIPRGEVAAEEAVPGSADEELGADAWEDSMKRAEE
ncbi:BQ5605_C008g05205 [Microbotryum silenes-dioicae]|uniref:BQ5605_C008g05205 protein n=1 Tax=Microbotryum silenes-dioicae TaxID=796604 RepID=A0A2X0MZF7_9BASI|nr:BQ5605_C008g05205 [Microbotryum silenes-dioicae]